MSNLAQNRENRPCAFQSVRPYGPYAGNIKDNLYLFGNGYLYTSPSIVARLNTRFYAEVAFALGATGMRMRVGSEQRIFHSVAIKPGTPRFVEAHDVCLLAFNINPDHRHFRCFHLLPKPGVLGLDAETFASLRTDMNAAFSGQLDNAAAKELHRQVFDIVAKLLPPKPPLDLRVARILDCLEGEVACSLKELAAMVRLSYKRVSLLFAQNVGLPLKSYMLWKKLQRYEFLAGQAGRTKSITELAHAAGFVDSAHLCRTFQEVFGAPPSYFFANPDVRVSTWLRCLPMVTPIERKSDSKEMRRVQAMEFATA
jgi:AraC family transcriptional regulator, arabinose operon regulatory protein